MALTVSLSSTNSSLTLWEIVVRSVKSCLMAWEVDFNKNNVSELTRDVVKESLQIVFLECNADHRFQVLNNLDGVYQPFSVVCPEKVFL